MIPAFVCRCPIVTVKSLDSFFQDNICVELDLQANTYDCMLLYRLLNYLVFTDTMFSNMYLYRNNKCEQVFTSDIGWICVYPMKTKGKVHNALSLMFQYEGIPLPMVCDESKEQTLGKFCQKLLKQTEPYSP